MERARRSALGGSRAGRGFRYQDAATAQLCAEAFSAARPWTLIPEGGDDVSLDTPEGTFELQIKSRQPHLGDVPLGDLATWLVDLDNKHPEPARLGIVVERNVLDVSVTGLEDSLAAQSPDALKKRLRDRHGYSSVRVEQLLQRAHLIVLRSPIPSAASSLSVAKDVPLKAAEILVRQIQARVGELADQQSAADAPPVRGLSTSDVASIINRTLEVIDLETLEAPVRKGLCEYVDFSTSVPDEGFYLGVDVVPGHVTEGLVFERPDDVENVLGRLRSQRLALVTGQSGAGKSALAWLSVYSSRNTISWIRVRPSAKTSDAAELIRFAESLRASPHAPVGFVIDNIVGELADLWDVLASETRFRPELILLGTVREEDLGTLTQAPLSVPVRTRMDTRLAKRIFESLRSRDQAAASGWKEAFRESSGLLLEYVHLLTTGTRLTAVIEQQIERRRQDGRDLELAILRIVSLAAVSGGVVSITALQAHLSASDGDIQRALVRLLDEHLVREVRDGHLGGLHDVRSQAICEASHRVPPPSLPETARALIACVPSSDLITVVGSLIHRNFLERTDAESELGARVAQSPDSQTLGTALNSLKQVSIIERAAEFLRILEESGIAPAHQELSVQLAAIQATDLDYLLPEIRTAVAQMGQVRVPDYRLEFLHQLPSETIQVALGQVAAVPDVIEILEAFDGMGESAPLDLLEDLSGSLAGADLDVLARALSAARAVLPRLGDRMVDRLGGVDELRRRAKTELPWTQRLDLAGEAEELRIEADWLFIGSSSQENPHESVVALCHGLAGLFPATRFVSVTAIDPSGKPAGIGDVLIAQKNIPRENLKTPQEIRWHRALIGAFVSLAGLPTKSDRLREEAELVKRCNRIVSDIIAKWLAGTSLTLSEIESIEEIDRLALQVAKQPKIPDDPLEKAHDAPDAGDAASACRLLVGNALPRLFTDESWGLAAFLHDTVQNAFTSISEIGYWDLLDLNLEREVAALTKSIGDVHAVLCGKLGPDVGDPEFISAMRSGGARSLEKAAEVSRKQGVANLESKAARAGDALAEIGTNSSIELVPAQKPSGLNWPALDVWVALELESLFDFVGQVEHVVDSIEPIFEPTRHVVVVPVRGASRIGSLAMYGRRIQGLVLPADRPSEGWPPLPEFEWAELSLHRHLELLVDGALRYVSLQGLARIRPLVDEERAALQESQADISSAENDFSQALAEDETGFLSEVLQPILQLINSEDFPERISRSLRGEDDAVQGLLGTVRLALIEWDLNPVTAVELTERFLAEHGNEEPPPQT